MIDISHQHARRLLRKNLDTHLPEGQWTMLQGHLEGCAACRAYREELSQTEKGLRRALRLGWDPIAGPRALSGAGIAGDFNRRQNRRQQAKIGTAALVAVALFFILGGPGWIAGLFRPAPETAGTISDTQAAAFQVLPTPTSAPTVRPGEFPEVVIYEDRSAGSSDIYLLNPGAEPVNLTENPAEDTSPAWSPDGAWIAFLSNRSNSPAGGPEPRTEVYVTDLTGRRVVQLTSQPGVRWEGPISWSPDGKHLALAGIREQQGGQRWIYQVGLDGSGAHPLPGTRGGSAPKYARFGDRLAYTYIDGGKAGLAVYHTGQQRLSTTSWPENALAPQALPAVAFDWSRDGGSLVYIAAVSLDEAHLPPQNGAGAGVGLGAPYGAGEMEFTSQIMAMRVFRSSTGTFFEGQTPYRVAASRWPSAFRSVSWTPSRQVVYLEDLGDARARLDPSVSPECWLINSVEASGENTRARRRAFQVGGLCVEGGFDMGSWTPDGEWMVVRGRPHGENSTGLFAVRMVGRRPDPFSTDETSQVPRLGTLVRLLNEYDAPAEALPRVRPRLFASQQPLNIDPRPVKPAGAALPPSNLSQREGGPPGKLVYVVDSGGTSVVAVTNPDGTGGRVLYASASKNKCPVWSPDGAQVALVSRSDDGREGLYLIDTAAQGSPRPRLLSDGPRRFPGTREDSVARFGCPVWSPRSLPGPPSVAVTAGMEGRTFLGILPVEGGTPVYALLSGTPAEGARPAWSQDGRTIYLALRSDRDNPSRVATVRIPRPEDEDPAPAALIDTHLVAKSNWGEIRDLVVRPNAPYLMLMTVEDVRGPARLALRQVSAVESGDLPRTEPAPRVLGLVYDERTLRANNLVMLPDGGYGLVLHGDRRSADPAAIIQYHLTDRTMIPLAKVEDPLYEVAWSPDGRWLVYTTESGLWGLDAAAAAAGRAAPVWLSPVAVSDIDWK